MWANDHPTIATRLYRALLPDHQRPPAEGRTVLTLPLILASARRLGMSVARVARQLGASGNFSQLFGSHPCAVGIIPNGLRVFPQDAGCLAELLGVAMPTHLANGVS